MKTAIFAAILVSAFGIAAPSISLAGPINNSDGSQTCNASGPSNTSTVDGVCANDLATNEGYCDGGMSSEPGGGTTCSPAAQIQKPARSSKLKVWN